MRFLLHNRGVSQRMALQIQGSSTSTAKSSATPVVKNEVREAVVAAKDSSNDESSTLNTKQTTKAWGQQCSPNCGCVVRFETDIDPKTDKVISASYYAKTIVTTTSSQSQQQQKQQAQQKLQPVLTSRTGRPLLTECSCQTLHQLASRVVEHLPSQKMSNVRNTTEFSSVRSSVAFRQTVLAQHELSKSDTHCFDVIEEAFTAMVKGHVPQPRPTPLTKSQRNFYVQKQAQESNSNTGYGSDRSPISAVPQQAVMSALYMMDVDPDVSTTSNDLSAMAFYGGNNNTNNNSHYSSFSSSTTGTGSSDDLYSEYYSYYNHRQDDTESKRLSAMDWVAYVDELNATKEEKSA